jgi:2-oxo-4-hydroxy-4-carboxy-5-ureidoimidazoline decarboxylase
MQALSASPCVAAGAILQPAPACDTIGLYAKEAGLNVTADRDDDERAAFVARYRDIFEHSPWVVERAFERGPFAGTAALHAAFMAEVSAATADEQLALICAHPELGTGLVLTESSAAEQTGAGLRALNAAELTQLRALNQAYRGKFGFPFIICVRQHDKHGILAEFQRRLEGDTAAEQAEAIAQIGQIAWLRLIDRQGV